MLDDIYGVLSESLSENQANPTDDWQRVYRRNNVYGDIPWSDNAESGSLRSNIVNIANGIRQRGNASTAARGNSNS